MSYAKLLGRIKEIFGTNAAFARALGLDSSTLSAKLNGHTPWKREEIEAACEHLDIPIEEVHIYFFARKLRKLNEQEN
jgi:hypothetical protein